MGSKSTPSVPTEEVHVDVPRDSVGMGARNSKKVDRSFSSMFGTGSAGVDL